MPSITDLIISGLLKKGIVYEAHNFDTVIDIPKTSGEDITSVIKVHIKIDNMTLKLKKEDVEPCSD